MLPKIIDVSVSIIETSTKQDGASFATGPRAYYNPGDLYVRISAVSSHTVTERDRMTSRLDAPVHAGTHVDAPLHRVKDGASINDIPLQTFMGRMRILALDLKTSNSVIDAGHLAEAGAGSEKIDRLMIKTGWFKKLGTPEYYGNAAPRLSFDAVQWIVSKGVKLLATDFVIDSPTELDLPLQRKLLDSGVCILANLTNLDQITKSEVNILALPVKIEGVEAAMCRAIVMED